MTPEGTAYQRGKRAMARQIIDACHRELDRKGEPAAEEASSLADDVRALLQHIDAIFDPSMAFEFRMNTQRAEQRFDAMKEAAKKVQGGLPHA